MTGSFILKILTYFMMLVFFSIPPENIRKSSCFQGGIKRDKRHKMAKY